MSLKDPTTNIAETLKNWQSDAQLFLGLCWVPGVVPSIFGCTTPPYIAHKKTAAPNSHSPARCHARCAALCGLLKNFTTDRSACGNCASALKAFTTPMADAHCQGPTHTKHAGAAVQLIFLSLISNPIRNLTSVAKSTWHAF